MKADAAGEPFPLRLLFCFFGISCFGFLFFGKALRLFSAVVLDTGPLGLLMQRKGVEVADRCRRWVADQIRHGSVVIVPEIADYEVRRELLRLDLTSALGRLNAFNGASPKRYLAITTASIRRAADFWSDVRKAGLPTAHPKALDGDVILAAQAMTSAWAKSNFVIATSNPGHLSRFAPAKDWPTI